MNQWAPCRFWVCKNISYNISWLVVIKGVPNQGVDCSVSCGSYFCFSLVFRAYVMFCFLVLVCQYQCN